MKNTDSKAKPCALLLPLYGDCCSGCSGFSSLHSLLSVQCYTDDEVIYLTGIYNLAKCIVLSCRSNSASSLPEWTWPRACFFLGQVKLSMRTWWRKVHSLRCSTWYNPMYPCLCCCVDVPCEGIIRLSAGGEEENRREGRGVWSSGSCSNRLCQPPAVVSSFISALCGRTKEQEGLGGVELADGVCPHAASLHTQKHSNARTSSVATNIGGMNVNDCGGEPVSGEGPLTVCVLWFFVPSVKATQKILCSLWASPVSTTRHRSANSGQNQDHYLPSTIIVGEFVSVRTHKGKLQSLKDVGTSLTVECNDPNADSACLPSSTPLLICNNMSTMQSQHKAFEEWPVHQESTNQSAAEWCGNRVCWH